MAVYLHFVRHAQGIHNVSPANHDVIDPQLTAVGEGQCADLCRLFPHHDSITHLVASPMRRTLQTCLLSFSPAVASGKVVTALPELQEVTTLNCDIGRDLRLILQDEDFKGKVNFDLVSEDWNVKLPGTPWAPDVGSLEARAAVARRWLRQKAREARSASPDTDVHFAVVSHGAMLHYLTQDWSELKVGWTAWSNAEFRTYEFADLEGEDDQAGLTETDESWKARHELEGAPRLSIAEQKPFRDEHQRRLQAESDAIVAMQAAAKKAVGPSVPV